MSIAAKICGLNSDVAVAAAVMGGAAYLGFVFYPPSPRSVSLPTALEIRAAIPAGVWCVGVFVNAERAQIASLVERLNLSAIQFHGDETIADLRGWPCVTIKALRVPADEPLPDWKQFPTDYLLLDTDKAGRYGGTGEAFAWERAAALPAQCLRRLILAGGLTPENVAAAVRAAQPWAVDVASGVESAPGRKDPEKLRAFITNAKAA